MSLEPGEPGKPGSRRRSGRTRCRASARGGGEEEGRVCRERERESGQISSPCPTPRTGAMVFPLGRGSGRTDRRRQVNEVRPQGAIDEMCLMMIPRAVTPDLPGQPYCVFSGGGCYPRCPRAARAVPARLDSPIKYAYIYTPYFPHVQGHCLTAYQSHPDGRRRGLAGPEISRRPY